MTPRRLPHRLCSTPTERSVTEQHFLDLCAVLGEFTPATVDPLQRRYQWM